VLAAVKEFGARPFDEVTVAELAATAKVTTGALYHHFGSKLGLYAFVREDVERRLFDRMEGAMAATGPQSNHSAAVTSALLVGLDFAVREGFLRILGDPPAGTEPDRLAEMLSQNVVPPTPLLGRVLAAAWRAALAAIAEGAEPEHARGAIAALRLHSPDGE
jgi:AcrR family transcriptional regulator